MTSRKPTAAFWIVVAIVLLPVVYVASFGPACWIASRKGSHELPRVYLPAGYLMLRWPRTREHVYWYATLYMPPESRVAVPALHSDGGRVVLARFSRNWYGIAED